MRNSEAIKNRGPSWRQAISEAQQFPIDIVSMQTGEVLFSFRNAHDAASALHCTRANLTNAARDGRPIGKKMRNLGQLCLVTYANQEAL
jgi:hypothetical protein